MDIKQKPLSESNLERKPIFVAIKYDRYSFSIIYCFLQEHTNSTSSVATVEVSLISRWASYMSSLRTAL